MAVPILGSSVVPREAMKNFVRKRNPNAPMEVIEAYYDLEGQWQGIRADVLICQMCLETEYLKSQWSKPPRRNMAGIGVTGATLSTNPNSKAWDYNAETKLWEAGYSFPDWTAAVQAHYAHMSGYCFANQINNARQFDPRWDALMDKLKKMGNPPPAKVLTDLNNRWAVPGPTYGEGIEGVLNAAITSAVGFAINTPAPELAKKSVTPVAGPNSSEWAEGVQGLVWGEFGPGTVANAGSYVRARPVLDPTQGRVLRKLDKGVMLHFVAYTDSGPQVNGGGPRWYLISSNEGGGWIYSRLIS